MARLTARLWEGEGGVIPLGSFALQVINKTEIPLVQLPNCLALANVS